MISATFEKQKNGAFTFFIEKLMSSKIELHPVLFKEVKPMLIIMFHFMFHFKLRSK